MLKNYSILQSKLLLIFLVVSNLYSSSLIEKGDEYFLKENYKKAIHYYLQADDQSQLEIKLRIIQAYLRIGDNYFKIKNYNLALNWYKKAAKLKNKSALIKMGKVYEKQADLYAKIHKYEKALTLYEKALTLQNSNLEKKINEIKQHLSHQKELSKDTRILVTKDSPAWTHSIGRLIIPTKLEFLSQTKYKTKTKKCSATLVNIDKNKNSNIIITASHCISAHNPKAGPLKFIIKNKNNQMVYRMANVEFDSRFDIKQMKKKTDFAILSLSREISVKEVVPLLIQKDSFISLQKKYKNSFGSLGGFSSDIAKYGANLTYDPKCKLSKYTKTYSASTCSGFKGASGGPIVLTTIDENKKSKHHFVGVVSHFKNKDFTNIYFAPHHLFYTQIRESIKKN